jgi:hypothetical protein
MEIEESYEDRLPNVATPNLSNDYQEHIRWVLSVKENRSIRGRLYYCGYILWDTFGNLTSLLLVVASVLTCVAAFTRSMLMEKNLFKAATYGGFFGIGVGSLLVLIDALTFWFGAFTDIRTKYRIRNYWHKGYLFLVAVIFVVLGLTVYALVRLFEMNEDTSKDYSLSHIFLN